MKYLYALLAWAMIAALPARAQDSTAKAVHWTYSAEKKSEGVYLLHAKASIQDGWILFSTTMPDDLPYTRITMDSATATVASISNITEQGKLEARKEKLLDANIKYFEHNVELVATLNVKGAPKNLKGTVSYMALKGEEITGPDDDAFKFVLDAQGNISTAAAGLQENANNSQELKRTAIDINHPLSDVGGTGAEGKKSLWTIFLLGFAGGFIALLTPCVFPMIPLTVSFFTKKAESRGAGIFNASMYGFFIFLIYVLLSTPFYFIGSGNSEILNNISTNVYLNIFFFIIFVVFAISFFGYFEITLPSGLASKVDSKASVGGLVGTFFMALTLALVSFSCTGPILGTLLAGALSTDGGAVQLTMGMAGFGLALALPFSIFALFPNLLKSLPKSGGWLTSVKVVLGFIEVAMALKFLSNADLVMHWGLLKREVFFGIWIVICILAGLYMLGKVRFAHDAPLKKISATRWIFAVIFFAFAAYLAPGVTNTKAANRQLISGFPPPLSYSVYKENTGDVEPNVRNDYFKALALAREQHKPVLIDFTGWACVNCRKMEENVWPNPLVKSIIKNDYILVSLYVDDRAQLPEEEQFLFTATDGSKKKIRTIGDKYATMQTVNFINNSQPFYVLISPDEKLLTKPVGYTPNAAEYAAWLKAGLDAYQKIK